MTADLSEDLFFGGRLRLLQPRRGHRVGTDAALLAAAARSRLAEGAAVVDLGAGVGAVGLALAALGAGRVAMVEIDPGLCALADLNADKNALKDRAAAVRADAAELRGAKGSSTLAGEDWDLVVSNPPFDDADRQRPSPDASRALAHSAGLDLAAGWLGSAARLLRAGGSFVMIHRPENLARLLDGAENAGFGDLAARAVHARAEQPASRILIAGRKGRRGPLSLLAPLILHGPDGRFTTEADAAQRGAAAIPMEPPPRRRRRQQ